MVNTVTSLLCTIQFNSITMFDIPKPKAVGLIECRAAEPRTPNTKPSIASDFLQASTVSHFLSSWPSLSSSPYSASSSPQSSKIPPPPTHPSQHLGLPLTPCRRLLTPFRRLLTTLRARMGCLGWMTSSSSSPTRCMRSSSVAFARVGAVVTGRFRPFFCNAGCLAEWRDSTSVTDDSARCLC